MTPLVSFGHCVVRPSSIYGFWWPLWYLLVIMLSVLLRFIKNRKSKKDGQHNDQKIPKGSSKAVNRRRTYNIMTKRYHVLSVLLRFTAFDDPFGIFWSLCCPSFFDLRLLMIPLVSFGHCVVRPSTKGIIKSRKSKKDGQHNDQKIPTGSSKA
jgi:hypothetical protein